jgi:hypothetical protein
MANLTLPKLLIILCGLGALLTIQPAVAAAHDDEDESQYETYILYFRPTQNAPPGASGKMKISVGASSGDTLVKFSVRHAYPNTLYTIWTVFNELRWPLPKKGVDVPASSAAKRPGFPQEGNGVSPLARLDAPFTSGMGIDPGASFLTDEDGDGEITLTLDYDLIREAPVSNKDVISQCVSRSFDATKGCPNTVKITTTWLRTFIGEFPPSDRARLCANYDPDADSDVVSDETKRRGADAQLWQCVDPASVNPRTGRFIVRVPRFEFDHFRLAAHPDSLTHGFIGGNGTDHRIDMVGRRTDLVRD